MIKFKLIYLPLIFFAAVLSCNDDDSILINEEEVITTLTATLTPQGVGTTVTLTSRDLEGDGPNAPVITVVGNLTANTTYTGTLEVLNETVSPAEDVTLEVEEEGTLHQFFYTFSNNIATTTYSDMDMNGDPIGIQFTLTTAAAGTGNVTITLRHELAKEVAGVSDGNLANAGGDTDVEATFAITVE
jgi:hypothetical protein